jgi:Leucine-rich repeat (LRR) protein
LANREEDEVIRKEVETLNRQIKESAGDLNIKNQKLNSIPRALLRAQFDNVSILDIRGNEIGVIEEGLCKNLS